MDKKWRLFSIFGHPVYMTPSFLIICVVLALINVNTPRQLLVGSLIIPVLFIGILLHELGHATASKKFGYGTSEILFWGLGGVAINRYRSFRDHKKNIAISLAGPAVSFLLGIVSGVALYAVEGGLSATGMLGEFFQLMMVLNLFWAVFNILPIHPMDGGQATMSLLKLTTKNSQKAIKYTAYISFAAIIAGLVLYTVVVKATPTLMLMFFAAYFAYMNYKMLKEGREVQIM